MKNDLIQRYLHLWIVVNKRFSPSIIVRIINNRTELRRVKMPPERKDEHNLDRGCAVTVCFQRPALSPPYPWNSFTSPLLRLSHIPILTLYYVKVYFRSIFQQNDPLTLRVIVEITLSLSFQSMCVNNVSNTWVYQCYVLWESNIERI